MQGQSEVVGELKGGLADGLSPTSHAVVQGKAQTDRRPLSILIVNKDLPRFPGGIGHEFLNTVGLAEQGATVGLVSMLHRQADWPAVEALQSRGVKTYLWISPAAAGEKHPSPSATGRERLYRAWLAAHAHFRAWPRRPVESAVADLEFRNMADALLKALEERAWDVLVVVQTSQAATVDYLPRFPASVLVAHDIRSLLFARRAKTGGILSWYFRDQSARYYRFEKHYASKYDLWLAVSQQEADWALRHYQPTRVVGLPLPLDTDYFRPERGQQERPNVILFTGLMNHPPNVDAACYFARVVFPRVRSKVPDAEFWIVGRDPAAEVLRLRELAGVVVTGEVADIRPYFAMAALFVVPLRFAAGSRNKILEAWAMEKCIVSTTLGAEGLDYQDGENIFIVDDPVPMAELIVKLLQDPELRNRVRGRGRRIVVEKHDWRGVARSLHEQFRTLAEGRAARQPPMRICVDLRWMLPGLAGGIENVARAFVHELIKLDGWNSYTLLLPARCQYDFDLRSRPNIRVLCPDSPRALLDERLWRLRCWLHRALRLDHWESPAVRRLRFLRSLESDIVFSLTGYIYADLHGLRHVVQVPDIQHEFFPEFFSAQALEERRRLFSDAIRRAEHICAISEFTRKSLIERMGVDPSRVTAVPLAADPIFVPEFSDEDRRVWDRYGLEAGRYLLLPAHTWWHKNHRAAIAALDILSREHGLRLPLVCTGGAREAQGALEEQIRQLGLQGHVRFLGYCLREEMPALYRGAACLVFPSLFEGFGMPVLEAMASGCPVVCSNVTSLPEIAGDAALMVAPEDHEGLADAVARLVSDGDLRRELVRRGLERAKQFSWRRYTLGVLAVLHKVHCNLLRVQPEGWGS